MGCVACGDTHTLVATRDGALLAFGRNQNGQLGLGSIQDSLSPQPVLALQVRAARWWCQHSVHALPPGGVPAARGGWLAAGC